MINKILYSKYVIWPLYLFIILTISCQKNAPVETEDSKPFVPTVTITSPTSGEVLKGPLYIEVSVEHRLGLKTVHFYVDNAKINEDSVKPYRCVWNAGFWADGKTHTLIAKAIDTLGTIGTSDTVIVTVDSSAVGFQLFYYPPLSGTSYLDPSTLALGPFDEETLKSVSFLVDGKIIGIDSAKPFEQYWYVGYWADGSSHYVEAIATAKNGMVAKSYINIVFSKDIIFRPISISPVNNKYEGNSTTMYTWNSLPTAEMYEIEIREFPNSVIPVFTKTTADTFLQVPTLPVSLYAWKVKAYNKQGRSSHWSDYAEFATMVTFSKTFPNFGSGSIRFAQQLSTGEYILSAQTEAGGATIKLDKFGTVLWQQNHSFVARAMKVTADHGFILACNTNTSTAALVKLNSNGLEVFYKPFTGFHEQYFYDVVENNDGSFFVGGSIGLDFETRNGWLLKCNSNGDTVFTKTIIENGFNEIQALQKFGSNIIVAGNYIPKIDSARYAPAVPWVKMMNIAGDLLWSFKYQDLAPSYIQASTVNPNGEILLAGTTSNPNSSFSDIWIAKTNSVGNLIWSKTYGGTAQDHAACISPLKDGGYLITGGYETSQWETHDLYVMKIDENGNQLWFKRFAYDGPDNGWSVCETADGGFLIGGASTLFNKGFEMRLIKIDKYGRMKFSD
ncbi:MAG: Ig-like domain-containing protein [Bacteroidota bacterium]|nr:Ig-like domain-containing protein [Bacteroidota bacterium]